jgi:outer membrane cobalamin receptor
MDEVVVTASRYPAMLKDIAVAVMVIEKEQIEALRPLTLGEVLHATAGIDCKDYGTPGGVASTAVRGIPAHGTLVLIDGHPLNYITNGTADLSVVDVNTIERIEIVKGPVSSVYGANALGAVVNIITERESSKPEIGVRITSSTTTPDTLFQTSNIFAEFGIPVHNTQLRLASAYVHSHGFRSNSDMTKYHVLGSVLHKQNDLNLSASMLYDDKEYGIPGPMPFIDSLHPLPQFGDSTATSLHDRERDKTLLGKIDIEWSITDHATWYSKIYADRKRTVFHTLYGGLLGDTVREDYDYLTHTVGLNAVTHLQSKTFDLTLGLDGHYDTLETYSKSNQNPDTTWHASSYNLGVWGELKIELQDILTVAPSIRFDEHSRFGGFISPGLGVVGLITQKIWLKFSLGKTFRAPTFNDLYWPLSGNPELEPEHGWAYELRMESSPLPQMFGTLSLFLRNVSDRIAWLPSTDYFWQPQNVNHLAVKGMDLEWRHQPYSFIQYTIQATYLSARQKNDEIVYSYYDWMADTSHTIIEEIERKAAFTPKLSLLANIDFTLPNGWDLNLAGSYVAKQVNYYPNYDNYPIVSTDTKILDSYLIINIALSKELFSHAQLTVGIKNMLNTDYATQFGYTVDDLDYPMPHRTFFVRLALHH